MESYIKKYISRRRAGKTGEAGFTLIEMLAVVGVMVLVSSLILANNSRFGGTVLLQNLAYEVALSVRQAQVYGISVRRFGEAEVAEYAPAYGVRFLAPSDQQSDARNGYVLFADLAAFANGKYDGEPELVQSLRLLSGYRIANLYVTDIDTGAEVSVDRIDISFRRPNPDAYIVQGLDEIDDEIQQSARIELASPREESISIVVDANGQISVQ